MDADAPGARDCGAPEHGATIDALPTTRTEKFMKSNVRALIACGLLAACSVVLAAEGADAPASAASAVKRAGHAVGHAASRAATGTGHAASEAATGVAHVAASAASGVKRAAHRAAHPSSAAS